MWMGCRISSSRLGLRDGVSSLAANGVVRCLRQRAGESHGSEEFMPGGEHDIGGEGP